MPDHTAPARADVRDDLASLRLDRGAAPPIKRRSRRRWPWLLVLLLVASGAFILIRGRANRAVPVDVTEAVVSPPGQGLLAPVLSGSGYVVTGDRYVSIGVRVPGRIEHYHVEEGQSVHKGDALVQLDDRDYVAAVERTQAALEVAKANASLAAAELARGRQLRDSKVISQQELDILVNKSDVTSATLSQIEAELQQAKVSLDYTILRAPTDGVILAKLKEVGEIAVPGGFAGSGDLIRMANLSDMRAEVDINEADLNRIEMGQRADVVPDAYPDSRYAAKVVKFYPQVDRQKGTLKVEVHIPEPDSKLLPDMSARITFLKPLSAEDAGKEAVLVPASAVREGGTKKAFVWLMKNGVARRVPIETAGDLGEKVRVSAGVAAGDQVITSDDRELRDGIPVTAG